MSERGENYPSQKETSKGLPIVSFDTIQSVWATYTTHENWGEHLEEVKQRLITENPELVKFIESQVGKFPQELHLLVFEVIVGTMAVLEHQAETNKLTSKFGVGPEEK